MNVYAYGKEVYINGNTGNLDLDIAIYNVFGDEVITLNTRDVSATISGSKWSAGSYLVQVKSAGYSFSRKVIIQ